MTAASFLIGYTIGICVPILSCILHDYLQTRRHKKLVRKIIEKKTDKYIKKSVENVFDEKGE